MPFLAVLRECPTDISKFVGAMEAYSKHALQDGVLRKSTSVGERYLNDRQKILFETVFSREKRMELVHSGADVAPFIDRAAMERKAKKAKAKKDRRLAGDFSQLGLEDEGGVEVAGGLEMQLPLRPKQTEDENDDENEEDGGVPMVIR